MGNHYNKIRSNIVVLVGAIAIMCLALGGSLFYVVRTLERSMKQVQAQIIPIKHGILSVAQHESKLHALQNEVISSRSVQELSRASSHEVIGRALLTELDQLERLLAQVGALEHTEFKPLRADVKQYLQHHAKLRQAKTKSLELEQRFAQAWASAYEVSRRQSQDIQTLHGLTRLDYILSLRRADEQASVAGAGLRQAMLELTQGSGRALSEQLPRVRILNLEFTLAARSLAATQDMDELNSIVQNEVKPLELELQRAYEGMEAMIPEQSPYRALFQGVYGANAALSAQLTQDSPETIQGLRRQIIEQQRVINQTQAQMRQTVDALNARLEKLRGVIMAALERLNQASIQRAERATWLSILAGLAALAACIVALQRTRRSVREMDQTNDALEQMSVELTRSNMTLEQRVTERTRDLHARNASMRLVMDHVNQGLLTVGLDGELSAEHSQVISSWFGAPEPGLGLAQYLGRVDPLMQGWIALGLESITDGFLPLDVALDQFPKQLQGEERTFHLSFTPIMSVDGECERLLVIISDITQELRQQQLEAQQRELLTIFERVSQDRASFMSFFQEADEVIHRLHDQALPGPELYRAIHTLKGNAGIFGLNSIASLCHELESKLMEAGGLVEEDDLGDLQQRWEELSANVERLFGAGQEQIRVTPQELDALIERLRRGMPSGDAAKLLASWRHEPTRRRLEHLAEQALALAERLGKAPIEVVVEADDSRHDAERWRGFWSSLVHVIRNAIDHGIETPQERQERDKPEVAKLILSAKRERDGALISVRDLGQGIDWERVRQRALERGLPAQTSRDLVEALFHDGLSTRDEVTQVSGRGVGMSAVKAEVERLGGTLEVHSEPGQGAQFLFWLPASDKDVLRLPSTSLAASPSRSTAS